MGKMQNAEVDMFDDIIIIIDSKIYVVRETKCKNSIKSIYYKLYIPMYIIYSSYSNFSYSENQLTVLCQSAGT